VHGANRLASNSLLEGLVFGARAGLAMLQAGDASIDPETLRGLENGDNRHFVETGTTPILLKQRQPPFSQEKGDTRVPPTPDGIRNLMWQNVGLFRDAAGLDEAVGVLEGGWNHVMDRIDRDAASMTSEDWRLASLTTVGRLIARAAWRREESRGGHYRLDHPDRDDRRWKRRIMETRS
jgi:L-aspartate oxidase